MITKDNFKKVLEYLEFTKSKDIYSKKFAKFDCELKVDFKSEKLKLIKLKKLLIVPKRRKKQYLKSICNMQESNKVFIILGL